MNVKEQKVLVVGTGISGIGAASLLVKQGAKVILYDQNEKLKEEDVRAKLPEGMEADIVIGALPEELRKSISLLVISPGVPIDSPLAETCKADGIPVWGEIELAYRSSRGQLIGITGTNGKTTTTSLVGEIMKDSIGEDRTFVVGNIGIPYTLEAGKTQEDSVTVAEISSFQLETTDEFHPKVSAILNITPDHLNRHHTMECYIETKERIAVRQTEDDVCVLNYENEYTRAFGEHCPASVIYFSSARKLENGYYLEGEDIFEARNGVTEKLLTIHDMNLVGACNYENVMAAIAMTRAMNVPLESILKTIRRFKAVEHRIEFVATKNGVDYYNDSKGTNPDAAIQGMKAMTKPTILIGGGYDKGSDYDEWIEAFDGKVKKLILLGQTAEKIAACARKHGFEEILFADSLQEVVDLCAELAVPGDAVLLSPACASWGMFPNYEVRGRQFKEMVYQLKE